ncbi:MAG: hypothetical protein AB2411_01310 [Mesobacillus sp.]
MVGALGFAVFLFFSLLLFKLVRNKEMIKKVKLKHGLIVVITFVFLLLVSTFAIYYAGNWLAAFIDHETLNFAFRIIWTLIIIAIISWIWESMLSKVKRDAGIE